jgi:hypothetical protein
MEKREAQSNAASGSELCSGGVVCVLRLDVIDGDGSQLDGAVVLPRMGRRANTLRRVGRRAVHIVTGTAHHASCTKQTNTTVASSQTNDTRVSLLLGCSVFPVRPVCVGFAGSA